VGWSRAALALVLRLEVYLFPCLSVKTV